MESQLLATKVQIPPQPRKLVHRGYLLEQLDTATRVQKATCVVAPAGYGKTSLLVQWARASRSRVAWLTLEGEDSDAERFFRYLCRAWELVQPDGLDAPLALLLESKSPDIAAVCSALVNAASTVSDSMVIVLDDYHVIDDASVHDSVAFLIDRLPQSLHLILAARTDPPLPLARYRARNELFELHADDLSFTLEESEAFTRDCFGLRLTRKDTRNLHHQTEGWAAGLQLAALTIKSDESGVDAGVSGQHRYIADYFGEDVVARQPEPVRNFLLSTSILDELCGALCDAVTENADGQQMLERLERESLFLVPLDDHRSWFRYHRLFAEYLRHMLKRHQPDDVETFHQRAARWYLANDLPEAAFDHVVAGGDLEMVIQIIDRDFYAKLLGGEMAVVQRWMDAIPRAWFERVPALAIAQAAFLLMSGSFDAANRCLDAVEQEVAPAFGGDIKEHLAKVNAIRCFIACFTNDLDRAERYAEQAIGDLPESDANFRPGIFGALGDTYRRNGRWDEAQRAYRQLLEFRQTSAFQVEAAHLYGALADLELRQGHLDAASTHWQHARQAIEERENWGRFPLAVIGWVYVRSAEISYERNDLAQAREYVTRGLARAEISGDGKTLLAGYLLAGRLALTEGNLAEASTYLEQSRPLVEHSPYQEWSSGFERFQVDLWIARNHLRALTHWINDVLGGDMRRAGPESESLKLALAHALLAKGDPAARKRASELTADVLQVAEAQGRVGLQIEALALQATRLWADGTRTDAVITLESALDLAEPEGYVRLFADLGPPMARLLQEARSRKVLPAYVARLLMACDVGDAAHTVPVPEPLTAREHDVLELLAAGLTNAEIAERLYISSETVKKHAGNIYAKLHVHTRTEAAARARALDLLR